MFKVFKKRELPSFLKEENEHMFPKEPVEQPKVVRRKKLTSKVESKQRVVDFLLTRVGQETPHRLVADYLGSAEPYATTLINELMDTGTIKRKGKRGHFKFTVKHKRVNKKRVANTKPIQKHVVQPVMEKPIPEVEPYSSAERKILAFIASHENVMLSQDDVARGSGTARSKISPIVRKLEEKKAIVRSIPVPRQGTRYWLYQSLKDGPNVQTTPAMPVPASTRSKEEQLASTIESLVWDFFKECKQTDILVFLEWLKQNKH